VSWRDALGLVARELRRRSGRSALTVAAVALAATLLTALVTITRTAQERVLSEVTTGGPLAGIKVVAAAPDPSQVGQDDTTPGPPKPLDDSGVARIRSLKDVAAVYPVLTVPVIVVTPDRIAVPGGAAASAAQPAAGRPPSPTTTLAPGTPGVGPAGPFGDSLVGVPLTKSGQLPVSVVAGRLPAPGSLSEVAVTTEFLNRVHIPANEASAMIGTSVEMGFPRAFGGGFSRARWMHPVIVGVADQDAGSGELVGSIELANLGRGWIEAGGPGSAAQFGLQATTYTGLFVIADRLDRVSTVRTAITAVGYSTSAPENLIASVQRYLRVVEIVLAAVGIIALVVAALGIANAMFAAVRERRREIGVLKAIGARDRDVLRVFLIEALTVGALGGFIGAALGTATDAAVGIAVNAYLTSQGIAGIRLVVSVPVLVLAVLGSGVLAVAAGAVPALRAARLPAREAVVG
jgi:macrolide transport system ATP-binding/permease protein